MLLDEECKSCLYNSQMKKVEREKSGEKLLSFKRGVKKLCENPPANYCAPLLMRDIDRLHKEIFGAGIDYSREKKLFNSILLSMEEELYSKVISSPDPLKEAMKLAMTSNYIDFARLSDLNESAVGTVISAADRAEPDGRALLSLKEKLGRAKTLCYLHDNCGEIVLDKILIRTVKRLYPKIAVTSVVRGAPIINDVTKEDAEEVGLYKFSTVLGNGSDVPGTYLKESPEIKSLFEKSDVIISKGLGNLETLYGEGYGIFYSFTCKCAHIAKRFSVPLWSAVLVEEIAAVDKGAGVC